MKDFGDRGDGIGGFAGVTTKSVAAFLMDTAVRKEWDGGMPVIANGALA